MNCNEARNRLLDLAAPPPAGEPLADHLESCSACAEYTGRLARTVRALGDHHARIEPDAGFADRVLQRLLGGASQTMGQAAMRLLPLSVALLLFLVWLTSQTEPTRSSIAWSENNEEAYMSWILQTAAAEGP